MGVFIGNKFGRLTVISDELRKKYKSGCVKFGLFKCDCGCIKEIRFSVVKSGKVSSCGCMFRELISKRNTIHSLSNTVMYRRWLGMKNRCYIKSNKSYHNYGGRGVTVCDEWIDSFINFYNWSILNGYSDDLTLDRIDVNGNYEPNNCRYVTRKYQNVNKRNNHKITINGDTKTISEWSEISGRSHSVIIKRISMGVPYEDAVFKKRCIYKKI